MIRIFILSAVIILVLCHNLCAATVKGYVTFPTVCHKVDRIEGDRLYLLSPEPGSACIMVGVRKEIDIDEDVDTVKVYIDGIYSHSEKVIKGFGLRNIDEIMKMKEQFQKELEKSPFWNNNSYREEGQKEAEKMYQIVKSDEYQEKIQNEVDRLKHGIFTEQVKKFEEYYSDNEKKNPAKQEDFYRSKTSVELAADERLYVFISSSVPVGTLRNYVRSLDRIGNRNARLIMRGFVDGMRKIHPTMEFAMKILSKDPDCNFADRQKCEVYNVFLDIDPLLFRAYNIQEVPAIVYVKGINVHDKVLSEGMEDNMTSAQATVLYGDVSLEYAVEMFRRQK